MSTQDQLARNRSGQAVNIIAADVGGTKTHLVYTQSHTPETVLYEARYPSNDFESFTALLQRFLEDSGRSDDTLGVLALALPGPVTGDMARLTNLPWMLEKRELQSAFGVERIRFINDFQASALGTLKLDDDDLVMLNQAPIDADGTRVVVGAGTGLGVSWVDSSGEVARAHATEGGHMDFAPVDVMQIEILQFLMHRHGHVSYERVLSGDGLVALYEFYSARGCTGDAAWVHQQAITGNRHAQDALRQFVRIYGAYIGNLAVLFKPSGGIYITGGIGVKIIDWMKSNHFIEAYRFKGRMRPVAERVAVRLVMNERVGVMGAVSDAVTMQ